MIWIFFRIEILLHFGVPDNKILLHFGVPDNQIFLHFDVPDNQNLLRFGVPDNCSWGPHLADRIGCAASVLIWRGNEQDSNI